MSRLHDMLDKDFLIHLQRHLSLSIMVWFTGYLAPSLFFPSRTLAWEYVEWALL